MQFFHCVLRRSNIRNKGCIMEIVESCNLYHKYFIFCNSDASDPMSGNILLRSLYDILSNNVADQVAGTIQSISGISLWL